MFHLIITILLVLYSIVITEVFYREKLKTSKEIKELREYILYLRETMDMYKNLP